MQENKLYNSDICEAFVCDVTKEELVNYIAPDSIDIATMIFVLSAIHPNKMVDVLKNIHKVLVHNFIQIQQLSEGQPYY